MRRGLACLVLGSIFLGASTLAAVGPNAIYELWRAGEYEQAIKAGTVENTPESLSIAARAAVSDMMMRVPPCLDCVHRAEEAARTAIAADPKAALPHIYLAVALGYEARIVGLLRSQQKGIPEESRNALGAAIAADPKNAFAIATLGGWNIDAVRIGGSMLARLTYGATIEDGISDYTHALAMDPNDFVIHYQYALSLAGYDVDKYRDTIATELARATVGKPNSVYESISQKRAADLLSLLKASDKEAFSQLVKRDMGVPE